MNTAVSSSISELFADAAAERKYFDSDAHYRSVAIAVLGELERSVGVLLTDTAAPNADHLARHLERECAPDRHVRIAHAEQLSSLDTPDVSDAHCILVVDHAGLLADDILLRLWCGHSSDEQCHSSVVLLGPDSLGQRLQAAWSRSGQAAEPMWLQLHRLARHEVDPYIRFRMDAAHLDERVFNGPLVALVETYADGDPAVVNSLAERILIATRGPAPNSFSDVVADLMAHIDSDVRLVPEARRSVHDDGRKPAPYAHDAASHTGGSATADAPPAAEEPRSSPEDASPIEPQKTASEETLSGQPVAADDEVAVLSLGPAAADIPLEMAEQHYSVAHPLPSRDEAAVQDQVTLQIAAAPEIPRGGAAATTQVPAMEYDAGLSEPTPVLDELGAPIVSPEISWPETSSPEAVLELRAEEGDEVFAPNSTEGHPAELELQITDGSAVGAPQAFSSEGTFTVVEPGFGPAEALPPETRIETPREEPAPHLSGGESDHPAPHGVSPVTEPPSGLEQHVISSETEQVEGSERVPVQQVLDEAVPEASQVERPQSAANGGISGTSLLQRGDVVEMTPWRAREAAVPGQRRSAIGPRRKWMIRAGRGMAAGVAVVLCVVGLRLLDRMPAVSAWFPVNAGRTADAIQIRPSSEPAPIVQAAQRAVDQQQDPRKDRSRAAAIAEPVADSGPAHETNDASREQLSAVAPSAKRDLAGSSSRTTELAALPPARPATTDIAPTAPAAAEPEVRPVQSIQQPVRVPSDATAPPAVRPVQSIQQPVRVPSDATAPPAVRPVQSAQEPVRVPPDATAPTTPSPSAELYLQRGDQLFARGDIIPARQFFERAAEGGDARAAERMARSYDPFYLRRAGVRGITGDPAKAKLWYEKAVAAGSAEAEMALAQLRVSYPRD